MHDIYADLFASYVVVFSIRFVLSMQLIDLAKRHITKIDCEDVGLLSKNVSTYFLNLKWALIFLL